MRNLIYPLNWQEIFDYVGFPAFLKPYSGGGWKHVYKVDSPAELFAAYDQSSDLCMTLQQAIDFDLYFRCYVVGQRRVHVMQYDPRQPHELGYDLNTVEFAVQNGTPYAIDFLNPAPDADLHSVGPDNFEWIVDAVTDLAVEQARLGPQVMKELRWAGFLNPQQTAAAGD
jgi:hypothetical protein